MASFWLTDTQKTDDSARFWNNISRYGVIHDADPGSQSSHSATLVVFIHGLFGDCRHTWGEMPGWVLEKADLHLDVISFDYPSKLWERASLEDAAQDLQTWLTTEYAGHRHIIFVTHSTGGLVVKHMLREEFKDLRARQDNPGFNLFSSKAVWPRTRHVVNISVPHYGGSSFVSGLAKTGYYLGYMVLPLLRLTRVLTQGNKDWGRNEILMSVQRDNPWLRELESEFRDQQAAWDKLSFPKPLIHDILAESDLSVPAASQTNYNATYFRGTHKSVKVPRRPDGPIVKIVSDFISKYTDGVGLTIADRTLARINDVNTATGINALMDTNAAWSNDEKDQPTPVISAAVCGTQSEICEAILASIHKGAERSRRMVVTGAGGVGKSAVMRAIAWRLACSYLTSPASGPLPLFIPLQQITATNVSLGADSWEMMWHWWGDWVHSLYPDHALDPRWLTHKLEKDSVAIILDGLDDFLINHSGFGLESAIKVLRGVTTRYHTNHRLSIIVSIRNTWHGIDRLATDPREIYEILRLSRSQAMQAFPACKHWLTHVQDAELVEYMLTPLILTNYVPRQDLRSKPDTLTRAALMRDTIHTFLARTGLIGTQTAGGETVESEHLLKAISLIAWLFFYKSRGEIKRADLVRESKELYERWRWVLQDGERIDGADDVATAFALVNDRDICRVLLQYTVFLSTGPEYYRFIHRSWQEFLLAEYLNLCLTYGHFAELGNAKFYSGIYRLAGDSFAGTAITKTQVDNALHVWRTTQDAYVASNLIGFLAWTRTPIEAQGTELLLDEIERFDPLSRIILIGGLGYRILVNDKQDYSRDDLRRALIPKLRQFSDLDTAPLEDPVASSLAWCYHKAFGQMFDLVSPAKSWPGLAFDNNSTLKALSAICTFQNGVPVLDARSQSLQRALLVAAMDTYSHPQFVIRAVHYLYYLIAAREHGMHILELSQELSQILAPGGQFGKIVKSFQSVPELLEFYKGIQRAYDRLEYITWFTPENPYC